MSRRIGRAVSPKSSPSWRLILAVNGHQTYLPLAFVSMEPGAGKRRLVSTGEGRPGKCAPQPGRWAHRSLGKSDRDRFATLFCRGVNP
jgi:hypothetical protein